MASQDTADDCVTWVKAYEPTTLNGRKSLLVKPTDLFLYPTDVVYVFPGALDIEKLKHALAQMLRDYPHAAGRLSHDRVETKWRIILNNYGVSIAVGKTRRSGITGDHLNNGLHPDICDHLSAFTDGELVDAPLLKFKIATWQATGETSLGVSFCHALGDATTFSRMMHSFSNYYQQLPPLIIPSFEKYLQQDVQFNQDWLDDAMPYLSYLSVGYGIDEYLKRNQAMTANVSRLDMTFSSDQLQSIKASATRDSNDRVSTMDALAAYLITVLNRVSLVPIQQVMNVVEFRGIQAAPKSDWIPPSSTSAGNAFCTVLTKNVLGSSVSEIARAMRDTLLQVREPEQLRRVYALYSEFYHRFSTNPDRLPWDWPTETRVMINNLAKLPFQSHHFGFQGHTRFYTLNNRQHFIRILPANPVKSRHGCWESHEGGVDVQVGVKHSHKSALLRIVQDDMDRMGLRSSGGKIGSKL